VNIQIVKIYILSILQVTISGGQGPPTAVELMMMMMMMMMMVIMKSHNVQSLINDN